MNKSPRLLQLFLIRESDLAAIPGGQPWFVLRIPARHAAGTRAI
jgi:hypothetical protein